MSGETWTEYGIRSTVVWGKVVYGPFRSQAEARNLADEDETIVGRTVTATPWLPVQDQP